MKNLNFLPTVPPYPVGFGKNSPKSLRIKWHKGSGWGDIEIINTEDLKISVLANGLRYGQCVFEGMKAHKNANGDLLIFRMFDHYERLNRSALRLTLPEIPDGKFCSALAQYLRKENLPAVDFEHQALYFQPNIFNTTEGYMPYGSESYEFTITSSSLTVNPLSHPGVMIEDSMQRTFKGGLGEIKASANYSASALATKNARELGLKHVLWMSNEGKFIQELSGMNLFLIRKDGTLLTPYPGGTILAGITRNTVIEIAEEMGIKVISAAMILFDLIDGFKNNAIVGAFGTGTASTLLPISKFVHDASIYNMKDYNADSPAYRIFNYLQQIYKGEVHQEWTYNFSDL